MFNLIIAKVVLDGWNAFLEYLAVPVVKIVDLDPIVHRCIRSK